MELFALPSTAKVNKVIPKNAFDSYTTGKQKKLFIDLIGRITWIYKISTDTVNLEAKDIKEIQLFRLETKIKQDVYPILEIIDKAIPYNIIFIIEYENMVYLSTSIKHLHPINNDNAVIDLVLKTDWFLPGENKYTIQLKKSIDFVYHDFCIQLSGKASLATKPLQDLVAYKRKEYSLEKEVIRLKTAIANSKQFKNKVELNLELRAVEKTLNELVD